MDRKTRRALPARIVEAAERQVGYHAQPEKRNGFASKSYEGFDWNGAYINRALTEAFGADPEVSFQSTVAALGYYVTRNRLYRKPKVGSIVFFNFATDPQEWDHQPHVGVVTELRADGAFRTVEGQTFTGKPQGVQLADGVHERLRQTTDVIGFVRPVPRTVIAASAEPSKVSMSYFNSNGKTVARAVETVQTAINRVRPAWTFNRGKRDTVFKSAVGTYARESGMVRNRGEITPEVLNRLEKDAGTLALEP